MWIIGQKIFSDKNILPIKTANIFGKQYFTNKHVLAGLELPNLSTSNTNTLTTTLIQQQQKQIDELKKQLDKALIRKPPPNFQSK